MSYRQEPWLKKIDEVIAKGPFRDDWASLNKYEVPEWFKESKFGIFIHWGVYSVPAFDSEWYSRNMYQVGSKAYEHHLATYGAHKDFGYKDFIPMFKAEKFDPDEWAQLFKDAGAKYVVPVCEHHDGFQMYKSKVSHWNAAEMGPKRDLIGDLTKAIHKKGLTTGGSSHRIEHYWFMDQGMKYESDISAQPLKRGDFYWPAVPGPENHGDNDAMDISEEYLNDWLIRTVEIIDKLKPRVLYFDWWIQEKAAKGHLKKLAAYYYNRCTEWGQMGVICYKHDAFMFGCALPDIERGSFKEAKPYYWQTDTAVARNSWCYTEGNSYKSVPEILQTLVDVVSKNGNLLLNIGPKADGTIPAEDAAILRGVGQWLKVNGKAIYGTKPWRISSEGDFEIRDGGFSDGAAPEYKSSDFRFTVNGDMLYAIAMAPSADGHYEIRSLAHSSDISHTAFMGIISEVKIPGYTGKLTWKVTDECLAIDVPELVTENPVVFRIKTK